MDRLQQISAEIIRLNRKQLGIWVLGKNRKPERRRPFTVRPQARPH